MRSRAVVRPTASRLACCSAYSRSISAVDCANVNRGSGTAVMTEDCIRVRSSSFGSIFEFRASIFGEPGAFVAFRISHPQTAPAISDNQPRHPFPEGSKIDNRQRKPFPEVRSSKIDKRMRTTILLLLALPVLAAAPVRSIDPDDGDFRDLMPLARAIGKARVVQLGEA